MFLYRSWVFMTEEDFQFDFFVFYKKCSCYPSAKKTLTNNWSWTGKNQLRFIRNINSQPVIQVVKDQNRWLIVLNVFGSLKKEMVYWNIFQLITGLNRYVELIYTEIFLEIKNILNDAGKILNFGQNGWIMFGMKIVHMLLILIL